MPHVVERASAGWKRLHEQQADNPIDGDFLTSGDADASEDSPDVRTYKQAWVRLLSKVYEIEPMVCPECGSQMKVIAVIQEPEEIDRILRHLVKQGRPPPGSDPVLLN